MKKKYYLAILISFLLFLKQSYAQSYREMMDHPDKYTFKQIRDAFYEEWEEKENSREKEVEGSTEGEQEFEGEYYQFKRWEEFMSTHLDETGHIFNYSAKNQEEIQKMQNAVTREQEAILPADWHSIGATSSVTPSGVGGGIGRVNCIAFHPTEANIMWVGTPAGGIWKTIDHGQTWVSLTDGYNPCLGISGIAVNPDNPDIIYILTGDGDGSNTPSIGVLKTTNGGLSWNPTAMKFNKKDVVRGYKIIMHPQNHETLFVATSKGVYKTTNGFSTKSTAKLATEIVYDIEFHPSDPTYIYLATNGNIYRSSNGGSTWKNRSAKPNSNLPAPVYNSRIALAVNSGHPDLVYAAYATKDGGYEGLYVSSDKGETFTQKTINLGINIMGFNYYGDDTGYPSKGQYFYDFTLATPFYSSETIFLGGINLWKSLDFGETWQIVTVWDADGLGDEAYIHADQHALEINPLNNNLYAGNDGGIYYSNYSGETWSDLSAGLNITQVYRVTNIDPVSSSLYFGTQDNGVNILPANSPIMHHAIGGDGAAVAFKNGTVFAASNYGGLFRNQSNNATIPDDWEPITPPSDHDTKEKSNYLIYYPFALDPIIDGTIWAGYDTLYKSTDNGNTWTPVLNSDGLGDINRMAVNNNIHQQIFVSTEDFLVKLNEMGEKREIDQGLPFGIFYTGEKLPLTDICLSADTSKSDTHAWVSFGRYVSGKKIYRTNDGGETWMPYSTGLPNVPVHCLAYLPGNSNHLVFAGTDIGVYYRDTTMSSWQPYTIGMPYVIVKDLKIDTVTNILTAATFGRGIWQTYIGCHSPLTKATITGEHLICPGETITLTADAPCGYDSYFWNTLENTKSIEVSSDGFYEVAVSNGSNTLTATHSICNPEPTGIVWEKNLQASAVGVTFGFNIEQTNDNGYIVSSAVNTSLPDQSIAGDYDWLITKLDMERNIQWQSFLGGTGEDYFPRAQQTSDGGFIISGMTQSNDGNVSGNNSDSYQDGDGNTFYLDDIWVVKLSASGSLVWQKCLGGPGNNFSDFVTPQQTDDGGYIVAGYARENGGNVSGVIIDGETSYAWVVKLNDIGGIVWQKCYGPGFNAHSIKQTSDGGFILAGTAPGVLLGKTDFLVLKLDASGNVLWQKFYGGPGYDDAYFVQQTKDDGYIVAGYNTGNGGYVSGNHTAWFGSTEDYWIVKLDAEGNLEWQKSLGGTGYDIAYAVQQTEDGGFVVAGRSDSYDGDVTGNHPGVVENPIVPDYWIARLDAEGSLLEQKSLGGSGVEVAYSMQKSADCTFVIAGTTTSNDGDVTAFTGPLVDSWIVNLAVTSCPRPYKDLSATDISTSAADLNWGTRDCVQGYQVYYRIEGNDNELWSTIDVETNNGNQDLSSLLPATPYEWRVRSMCQIGENPMYSEFSPMQTFTTLPIKTGEPTSSFFEYNLYPNPTTGSFTVELQSLASGNAYIEIYSVLGNSVYTDNLNVTEGRNLFNFSSVLPASGLYFVSIRLNDEKAVRKILKI